MLLQFVCMPEACIGSLPGTAGRVGPFLTQQGEWAAWRLSPGGGDIGGADFLSRHQTPQPVVLGRKSDHRNWKW